MRIRTLLNQCQKHKSFSFTREYLEEIKEKPALIIEVEARKNSKPICSGCQQKRTQYDRMPTTRDDQFIPVWGFQVYFRYRRRRVDCPECGIKVEQVSWQRERKADR